MTSPGDSQPPKDWWLENACRIAAFRLRQAKAEIELQPLFEINNIFTRLKHGDVPARVVLTFNS